MSNINQNKLFDIFISYSSSDKKLAIALCHFLEERGLRCWIAPRDIQAGQIYSDAIIDAISASNIMVVVFSKSANASTHVRNEVERAFSHQLVIMPFRTQDIIPEKSFEYFLSSTHWLDAIDGNAEDYFDQLYKHCSALLQKGNTGSTLPPSQITTSTNLITNNKNQKKIGCFIIVVATVIAITFFIFLNKQDNDKIIGLNHVPDSIAVKKDSPAKTSSIPQIKHQPALTDSPRQNPNTTPVRNETSVPSNVHTVDLSAINGATFEAATNTDKLTFISTGNRLQFSGNIAGYDVSGYLKNTDNMSFTVIKDGNVSGNITFTNNNNTAIGSFTFKEGGFSHSFKLEKD